MRPAAWMTGSSGEGHPERTHTQSLNTPSTKSVGRDLAHVEQRIPGADPGLLGVEARRAGGLRPRCRSAAPRGTRRSSRRSPRRPGWRPRGGPRTTGRPGHGRPAAPPGGRAVPAGGSSRGRSGGPAPRPRWPPRPRGPAPRPGRRTGSTGSRGRRCGHGTGPPPAARGRGRRRGRRPCPSPGAHGTVPGGGDLLSNRLRGAGSRAGTLARRHRGEATAQTHGAPADPAAAATARSWRRVVADRILGDIAEEGWPEGEVVGSEAELLERYGVSRAVFREAVRLLEHLQVARMRRGPGGGLVVLDADGRLGHRRRVGLPLLRRRRDRRGVRGPPRARGGRGRARARPARRGATSRRCAPSSTQEAPARTATTGSCTTSWPPSPATRRCRSSSTCSTG